MKIMHLTDTHVKKSYGQEGVDGILQKLPSPIENVRKILSDTIWTDVDLLVITGDLVHEGTPADYHYLKAEVEALVPSTVKILYVLGNHDHKDAFFEVWERKYERGSYYYEEELDGYRLIVLDSAVAGKESGTIIPEELDWLREVLARPSQKGSIIFVHHPLFWNGETGFSMEITNSEEVLEVLRGSDVFAVFSGHTHANAVSVRDEILQYTADSSAFSLEILEGTNLAFTDKVGYVNAVIEGKNVNVHFETCKASTPIVCMPLASFEETLKKMDE